MVVAAVAVLFSVVRYVWLVVEDLPFMPHISLLAVGQRVVTYGDVPVGEPAIPSGTRCLILKESAWDDDSCYPRRDIKVKVCEGQRKGDIVTVTRDYLRSQ
jgi:hypothetical protein